jgi:hypothetical protein
MRERGYTAVKRAVRDIRLAGRHAAEDALARPIRIGDLEDGARSAEVPLRDFDNCPTRIVNRLAKCWVCSIR